MTVYKCNYCSFELSTKIPPHICPICKKMLSFGSVLFSLDTLVKMADENNDSSKEDMGYIFEKIFSYKKRCEKQLEETLQQLPLNLGGIDSLLC